MGIFTSNTHYSINDVDYTELPALEGYDAVTGCAMAMLEVQQNDMALFNATIMEDFKEVAAVNEGYEVLNESAMDVLNKIKEIFKKLLQKIKGIFKTFLAKLMGTFGTNAGMYDKYKNQISRYTNWKDFKVKDFREVKGKGSGIEQINKIGKWNKKTKYEVIESTTTMYGLTLTNSENFADSDEICEAIIKNRLVENLKDVDGDLKNMTQEYMDAVFEDKETKDEWIVSEILNGCVGSILQKNAGGKFKESVENANKSLSDAISKIINELDKSSLEINKAAGNANLNKSGDDTSYSIKKLGYGKNVKSGQNMNANTMTKKDYIKVNGIDLAKGDIAKNSTTMTTIIGNLQKIATQEQNVITAFTAARLAATKFLISQARRVWSSAAAYSSREHKNEGYDFYTAVGESAAYDFDSYMEAIGE